MKSNRTHQNPPIIEDLGNGTSYYNFDVEESSRKESGQTIKNFDYEQVTVQHPITKAKIMERIEVEGYYVTGHKTRLTDQVKADCLTLDIPN